MAKNESMSDIFFNQLTNQTMSWRTQYLILQGRHGRFLAGKAAIVVATSPARRRCRRRF